MPLHFTPSTPVISDLTLHLQMPNLPQTEQTEVRGTFFPSEWHPQSGVQLTWPHAGTDWAPLLAEADDCFVHIALEVLLRNEIVLVVTPEPERVKALMHERIPARLLPLVRYFECPTNDTWARDHAFLTLLTEDGPRLLDFQFNGWGMKFPAELDNQICRRMADFESLPPIGEDGEGSFLHGSYEPHLDFVFEGGSVETDGKGTLLVTSQCLLSPNRNPSFSRQEIEERLLRYFHANRVLWLDHGYLAGDDTDSHIDTLARFCPNNVIAYVQCTDPADEHFEALAAMEEQLKTFSLSPWRETSRSSEEPSIGSAILPPTEEVEERLFHLIPLPLPDPVYDPDDGHRLPATYANFLILNGAVLMPTYGQPVTDELARRQLQKAFPKYDIVPVDSRILIRQHGSIHCSTMQYPVGVVKRVKSE